MTVWDNSQKPLAYEWLVLPSNGQQEVIKLDHTLCGGEKTYCESQVGITQMRILIHLYISQKCLRAAVHIHAYISAPMYASTHHRLSRNVGCIIWHCAHQPLAVSPDTAASVRLNSVRGLNAFFKLQEVFLLAARREVTSKRYLSLSSVNMKYLL